MSQNESKKNECKQATLPVDAAARKAAPIFSGVMNYFPDALFAVAELSKIGNEQHNPGKPLQWDRSKSTDHADCIARHLIDAGTMDTDGVRHSAKVAWRALALLQVEIEKAREVDVGSTDKEALFPTKIDFTLGKYMTATQILDAQGDIGAETGKCDSVEHSDDIEKSFKG